MEGVGCIDIVRVNGDCMAPRLLSGSLVCIDRERPARPGDLVVARTDDEVIVKELHAWGGELWLVAIQGPAPLMLSGAVQVLGVVTMVMHTP